MGTTDEVPQQLPIQPMPLAVTARVIPDQEGMPWGVVRLDTGVASLTIMAQAKDLDVLGEQIKTLARSVRKAGLVTPPSPLNLNLLKGEGDAGFPR